MLCYVMLSDVVAVTLPGRETGWNLLGCPKLYWTDLQPLVGRSSPYCGGNLEEILLLNKFFFRLSIRALVAKT